MPPPTHAAPFQGSAPPASGPALAPGLLPLGAFAVSEADGLVSPRQPGLAPTLRFAWRGKPCRAALDGGLFLSAEAGRLPATATGADRAAVFAALPALRALLPKGWTLRLLPDHRLRVEARSHLPAPTSAVAMVAALVTFALCLDPWLDKLAGSEAGMGR
ncbi:hypothetical protein [Humitalea rosea]|nr:hypothetical protein [Humitalea rosea]